MTMDTGNFYLGTPMRRKEYMRIKLTDLPEEIINQYNLRELATADGWVYVEIGKGMYGLPQNGIIAQEQLAKRLEKHGYKQSTIVPGFWTHISRPIQFTLVVDDFGVKYTRKQDVKHLLAAIEGHYDVTVDWEGKRYIGLTLDWDYQGQKVHLSMPGYITDALQEYDHPQPTRRQDAPAPYTPPNYGAKKQFANSDDDSPTLNAKQQKIHPRRSRKIQLCIKRNRFNDETSPQQHRHRASNTNREHNEKIEAIFGLRRIPRRTSTDLRSQIGRKNSHQDSWPAINP